MASDASLCVLAYARSSSPDGRLTFVTGLLELADCFFMSVPLGGLDEVVALLGEVVDVVGKALRLRSFHAVLRVLVFVGLTIVSLRK